MALPQPKSRAGSETDWLESNHADFVTQVVDLLGSIEDRKDGAADKVQEVAGKLRLTVEEHRKVVMPRLKRAIEMIRAQRRELKDRAKPIVRKVVTGDEQQSVRLWLKKYKVVKAIDKATFVGGVCFMQLTQFVILIFPEKFNMYFVASAVMLLSLRLYTYRKAGLHFFLLDYCYLTNLLCVLNATLMRDSALLWQCNFVACNGPLLWAIVAWRNSLVFHSLDKVVSIFIHVVPALLTYSQRWNIAQSPMCWGSECVMTIDSAIVYPTLIFVIWQLSYLIVTELILKPRLDSHPELMTSLRWIAKDTKNGIHKIIRQIGLKLHILDPEEELDLAKRPYFIISTFVMLQTIYTLATFLPAWFLFSYQYIHLLFIIAICVVATYNGANFYFEVFAKRYEQDLQTSCPQEIQSNSPSTEESKKSR